MAEFTRGGALLPQEIIWEDGRKYGIDRVVDVRQAFSTKAGSAGTRYTCMVGGQEVHLFYEENNLWFLERRH